MRRVLHPVDHKEGFFPEAEKAPHPRHGQRPFLGFRVIPTGLFHTAHGIGTHIQRHRRIRQIQPDDQWGMRLHPDELTQDFKVGLPV